MKVLDANVLVALYRPSHVHHVAARSWSAEEALLGEPFTVPDLIWMTFCRLMTNRRVVEKPATFQQVWAFVTATTAQGHYATYASHPRTMTEFAKICAASTASANLINDAYLAAAAATLGGTVVTFDRDFRKFDGVRVVELGG